MVASITVTLSGSTGANIGLSGVLGASTTGFYIAVAATGGVISVSQGVPPTNVNVVPGWGSGSNQKFTAIYVDAQGYQDISEASFMMANDVSG